MMLRLYKFTSFLFIGFTGLNGFAQNIRTISLEEALSEASSQNQKLKASAHTAQASNLDARTLDYGKATFALQYGQYNSAALDNNFSLMQGIPYPGTIARYNQLRDEVKNNSEALYQLNKNDLQLEVKAAYLQYVFMGAQITLLQENDSLYKSLFLIASRRLEAGEGISLEKLTAEAQWKSASIKVQQGLYDLRSAHNRLRLLINTQDSLIVREGNFKTPSAPIDADSVAISNGPQAKYLSTQEKVLRKQWQLSKSKLGPDLAVGGFSQTLLGYQTPLNGPPDGYRFYGHASRFNGLQVAVSVPLWYRPYTNKNKALEHSLKAFQETKAYEMKRYQVEFRQLVNEYSKWREAVNYSEKIALPQAELIFAQAKRSYQTGALSYAGVIQSIQTAITSKTDYITNLYRLNATIYQMEWLLGNNSNQ